MALFFLVALPLCAVAALAWWAIRKQGARLVAAALILLMAAPGAYAASLGGVVNPIIDQLQVDLVGRLVESVVGVFFLVATWISGKVGIRFVERLNRQTLQEAATRYANSIIDQIQLRYLGSAPPDLSDLIGQGITYIKTGNAGTVKQTRITDDRLGTYIEEAIQGVRMDKLAEAAAAAALKRAGAIGF